MKRKIKKEEGGDSKLTVREILDPNTKLIPGSKGYFIREENIRLGKLAKEKTEMYDRILEAYNGYYEKEDGIKIKLLSEEISETFSLQEFWSLSKENLVEIIYRFVEREKMGIEESRARIRKQLGFALNQNANAETLFDCFVGDKEKLAGYIKEKYSNAKPKQIVCIVYALINLGIISKALLENKSDLHKLIEQTFHTPGTRQALNNNLNDLRSPNQPEALRINRYEDEFKPYR